MERHGGGANLILIFVRPEFLFFQSCLPCPSVSRGRQGADGVAHKELSSRPRVRHV